MNMGKIMLMDYCIKTVATNGGDGYDETVLYQNQNGNTELHFYSKYENDTEEKHSCCFTDPEVVSRVYGIIKEYKLAEWNNERGLPGLCGAVYILKYRTEQGDYVRVSSENMPENGMEAMRKISSCLNGVKE